MLPRGKAGVARRVGPLAVDTGGAQHPQPGADGIGRDRLDQGGLSEAGFPGHHERATMSRGPVDERAKRRDVLAAPHQVDARAELPRGGFVSGCR
jgi:hypothetical protein